tara:strand:+ start:15985 stop:16584 length:600 start_codon:yes stop_codon:yes gene_type:complete
MIEFFEENLGSITLLLAIGTFWMALSTRASASASKKIFELEARPCLVFNKPMFRLHQEAMRVDENKPHINKELTLGIEFKNPSRVPLRYSITSIRMTFDSRTVDNPTFNTSGALIYPGDFGVFWFGTLPYHEQLNVAKQGVIEYTVKYEAIDHKRGFIKTERMSYVVASFDNFHVDWRYLEDSEELPLTKSNRWRFSRS